jgi:hypothetical protein
MRLTAPDIQQIQGYLRNTAEVDPNDTIANAASQLAVDLEYVRVPFDHSSLESHQQALIQYAVRKRNQYVLLPGCRHAVDLERVELPRRTLKKG